MIKPPPAFSIREADEQFCPAWREIGRTWRTMVDGIEQHSVLAYDEAGGWLRRYRRNDGGRGSIMLLEQGEQYAPDYEPGPIEETVHGVITNEWLSSEELDAHK